MNSARNGKRSPTACSAALVGVEHAREEEERRGCGYYGGKGIQRPIAQSFALQDGGGVHSDNPSVSKAVDHGKEGVVVHANFPCEIGCGFSSRISTPVLADLIFGEHSRGDPAFAVPLCRFGWLALMKNFLSHAPEDSAHGEHKLSLGIAGRVANATDRSNIQVRFPACHPYMPSIVTGVFSTMTWAISGRGRRSIRIQLSAVRFFTFTFFAKAAGPTWRMY
jgi:hypothetical protein